MKSEKYIKENLNEAFSDIAPDILGNILQTKRIEDNLENDLRDEPLFLDDVNEKKKWIPAGVFTCIIAVLILVSAFIFPKVNTVPTQKLATITFDINPSMDIQMNEKGEVLKAVANNKDAEEIVAKINKKLEKGNASEDVLEYVAKQLEKAGYLKDEKAVMLVSANKDEDGSAENLKNIKNIISNYKKSNDKKFVTIYYEYRKTEEVEKLAKKNEISTAKAAYCLKVSEKTDAKIDEICHESISEVTSQLMSSTDDWRSDFDIDEDDVEFIGTEEDTINDESGKEANDKTSNDEIELQEQSESEISSEATEDELQENLGEGVFEPITDEATGTNEEAVFSPGISEENIEQTSKVSSQETTSAGNT